MSSSRRRSAAHVLIPKSLNDKLNARPLSTSALPLPSTSRTKSSEHSPARNVIMTDLPTAQEAGIDGNWVAAAVALESPNEAHSPLPPQAQLEEAAIQASTTIEAADRLSVDDSSSDAGYESEGADSATTTLSSTVRDYVFENGRRYHRFREGVYNFPNDDAEQDREDMKHAMLVAACGDRLHLCPMDENPQEIIDLGTGTGIWVIEMAEKYPSATVHGVDLSPIQPTWVPSNVRFIVDDVESPWLYKQKFDLVHMRNSIQSFRNFEKVLQHSYAHLKPGGWVECQEMHAELECDDGTMPPDCRLAEFLQLVRKGMKVLGPDMDKTPKLASALERAGFTRVVDRVIKVPVGPWARNKTLKKVGLYMQVSIMEGLQGIALGALGRGLGWRPEDIEVYLIGVRESLRDRNVHGYLNWHLVYGQRAMS